MESRAQMTNDSDENRPQVGSVGFILSTRSLCVYTPLGWVDVEVGVRRRGRGNERRREGGYEGGEEMSEGRR